MKLILIDGGPASGKNTLGELLVNKISGLGEKAILLDLDAYVEQYNPKWIWESNEQKEKDQLKARINFYKDINKYLKEDCDVVVIGERFLTAEDIQNLTSKITANCVTYLYHLSAPFAVRERRLHSRGPHSLIDLEKDQRDRERIKAWPGHVYKNINSPEEDARNLFFLIQQGKGLFNGD